MSTKNGGTLPTVPRIPTIPRVRGSYGALPPPPVGDTRITSAADTRTTSTGDTRTTTVT